MKRILIVEDEPELQELLCAYLQDAGYAAAVAGDGAAALDLFRAQSFDLVLLDIMLPKIDGFGVCAQIRRQSQVPILMLTALDGETQQLRGFGLNIDDYVTKPFSMPVLLEKIRVILLSRLWGYDFFGDERVVDSHIKNLRHKLGRDYIETVRGVGYRAAKETR